MALPTGCREVTDQGVTYYDSIVLYNAPASFTMVEDAVLRWDYTTPGIDPASLGAGWFVEPGSVVEHYLAVQSSDGTDVGPDVTFAVPFARSTQGPQFDSGSFSGGGGFGLTVRITGFFIVGRIGVPTTTTRIICESGGGGTPTQTAERLQSGYRIEWDQWQGGSPQLGKLVLGSRVGLTIPSLGMADRPHVQVGWKAAIRLGPQGQGFETLTTLIFDKLPFTNPTTGGSLYATINDSAAGIDSGALIKGTT